MNNFQIDPTTLASFIQIGGQYMLPIAALLRALYSGYRGKAPEGIIQILGAAAIAGVSSSVNGQPPNLQNIVTDILGNTVFTAGLLAFIVVYLIRVTNLGWIMDVVVGGIIGGVLWFFSNYWLDMNWSIWLLFLIVPACAVGMILLRFALRQIFRVVRIATYLVVIGLVLAIGAGGFLLLQTVLSGGKLI